MFPKCVERLADVLAMAFRLNKARDQCLAGIVVGAADRDLPEDTAIKKSYKEVD